MKKYTIIFTILILVLLTGCQGTTSSGTQVSTDTQVAESTDTTFTDTQVAESTDTIQPVDVTLSSKDIVDACSKAMQAVSGYQEHTEVSQTVNMSSGHDKYSVVTTATQNKLSAGTRYTNVLNIKSNGEMTSSDIFNETLKDGIDVGSTDYTQSYFVVFDKDNNTFTAIIKQGDEDKIMTKGSGASPLPLLGYLKYLENNPDTEVTEDTGYYILSYNASNLIDSICKPYYDKSENGLEALYPIDIAYILDSLDTMGIDSKAYLNNLGDAQFSYYINKDTYLIDKITLVNAQSSVSISPALVDTYTSITVTLDRTDVKESDVVLPESLK